MRQCVKAALRHYNTTLLRQCGVSEVQQCGIAALPYSVIEELRWCGCHEVWRGGWGCRFAEDVL